MRPQNPKFVKITFLNGVKYYWIIIVNELVQAVTERIVSTLDTQFEENWSTCFIIPHINIILYILSKNNPIHIV